MGGKFTLYLLVVLGMVGGMCACAHATHQGDGLHLRCLHPYKVYVRTN